MNISYSIFIDIIYEDENVEQVVTTDSKTKTVGIIHYN